MSTPIFSKENPEELRGSKGPEGAPEDRPNAQAEMKPAVKAGGDEEITAEKLACKYCGKRFENRGQLLNHYRTCTQHPRYKARVREKKGIYKEGPEPNKILREIVEGHPDIVADQVDEIMSWADMSGGLHPMQVSYLLATMKGISKTTADIVASKYSLALQKAQAEGRIEIGTLGAGVSGILQFQQQAPVPGLFPTGYSQPGMMGGGPTLPMYGGVSPLPGFGVTGFPPTQAQAQAQGRPQGMDQTVTGMGGTGTSVAELRQQWEQEHQIKTMAEQLDRLRQQLESQPPAKAEEPTAPRVEEKLPEEYVEEPLLGQDGKPILDKKGKPYIRRVRRTIFATAPAATPAGPGESSMTEMLKLIQASQKAGFEQAKAMYEFASKSGEEGSSQMGQMAGMGQMEVVEIPVDSKGQIVPPEKAVTIMRKTRPLGTQEQVSPMQLMEMMQRTRDTGFSQALEAIKVREQAGQAKPPQVDEEKLLSRTREAIREETSPLRQTIDALTTEKKIGEAIQSAVGPYKEKISELSGHVGAPINVQLLRQQQEGLDKIGERTERAIRTVGGELRETFGMVYGAQGSPSPTGQYQTRPGQLAQWTKKLR